MVRWLETSLQHSMTVARDTNLTTDAGNPMAKDSALATSDDDLIAKDTNLVTDASSSIAGVDAPTTSGDS